MELDPRLIKLIEAIKDPQQRQLMAEKLAQQMEAPPMGQYEQDLAQFSQSDGAASPFEGLK